jgi:hypothetical protein
LLGFESICGDGRLQEEVPIPPGVAIWVLEYARGAAAMKKRDPVWLRRCGCAMDLGSLISCFDLFFYSTLQSIRSVAILFKN